MPEEMLRRETEDEFLSALTGIGVPSAYQAQVSYRLNRLIAKGGSAAAFVAVRRSPILSTPVVLKVVRPTALLTGHAARESGLDQDRALGTNSLLAQGISQVRVTNGKAVLPDRLGRKLHLHDG